MSSLDRFDGEVGWSDLLAVGPGTREKDGTPHRRMGQQFSGDRAKLFAAQGEFDRFRCNKNVVRDTEAGRTSLVDDPLVIVCYPQSMSRTPHSPAGSSGPRSRLATLKAVIRDHLGLNVSTVEPRVARAVYAAGASVRNCDATCCLGGTTVSVDEQDKVLRHRGIVAEAMTSRARDNPDRWFGTRTARDSDFTAGRTANTRVLDGACVFLREDRLCALQVAGQRRLGSAYSLKPATCLLWPLCVQDGRLEIGHAWFTRRTRCCAPVRRGERTIWQVMAPDKAMIEQLSLPAHSRGGGPPR